MWTPKTQMIRNFNPAKALITHNNIWNDLRSDFGPTWNLFFGKTLISYSRFWAETVFFHINFSRRIHWCSWEPVKTPHLKKFVNSENANCPENQPCKNDAKSLNSVWNGFRKLNLGHGDLDMAPNFDLDALVIVPDPKKPCFQSKNVENRSKPKI